MFRTLINNCRTITTHSIDLSNTSNTAIRSNRLIHSIDKQQRNYTYTNTVTDTAAITTRMRPPIVNINTTYNNSLSNININPNNSNNNNNNSKQRRFSTILTEQYQSPNINILQSIQDNGNGNTTTEHQNEGQLQLQQQYQSESTESLMKFNTNTAIQSIYTAINILYKSFNQPNNTNKTDQSLSIQPITTANNNNTEPAVTVTTELRSVDIEFSGNHYRGTVNIAGQQHGQGSILYSNGNYYSGEWFNGQQHGIGKLIYSNESSEYNGEFVSGVRSGYGIYTINNSNNPTIEQYKGYWLNNNRSGSGEYYINSKLIYSGEWLNNERHGLGTAYYYSSNTSNNNGELIESWCGEWQLGLQNGNGIRTITNNSNNSIQSQSQQQRLTGELYEFGDLIHWKLLSNTDSNQTKTNNNSSFNRLLTDIQSLRKELQSKLSLLLSQSISISNSSSKLLSIIVPS